MITDSKNIVWTPSEDRSVWTSEDGRVVIVNPEAIDEQILAVIESLDAPQVVEKTPADRIAELEAKLAELLSKLP